MSVLIETTIGDLVFDLYIEDRPRSCLNFLKLCKIKYYNFCLFHSIRRNFIAQCGDPTGTGRGGESVFGTIYGDQAKYFDLELKPRIKHQSKGTISFVNNGNNMHGSQFFITLGDGLDFLDGKHTVFGKLTEGFDVLEKLNETICDDSHKSYQDIRISHTMILDDPFDDPKGLVIPEKSPEPTKEQLDSGRLRADEDLDDGGKTKEEIEKEIEDKELKIGTKILETIGDIDNSEEKPPENVLFVCKLNPVTNEDDLKIIFSRFGKIISCEIIKDKKTDDSLCYGFVEFKEVESCEKAYFKMDNVLIDDRRIHVDFCQSMAKIKKFHNTALYKMNHKDEKSQPYKMKQKKNEDKKYSMVFDDDTQKNKMSNKDGGRAVDKRCSKREYDSESESDTNERARRNKVAVKEKKKRRESYSSSSEDDRSPSPDKKTKGRKSTTSIQSDRKSSKYENTPKVDKTRKYDRDLSSEDERSKSRRDSRRREDLYKREDRNTKTNNRRSISPDDNLNRSKSRDKNYRQSDLLDRSYNNRKNKFTPKEKKRSKYSDSDTEKSNKKIKKLSLKDDKKGYYSSDEDFPKKEKSKSQTKKDYYSNDEETRKPKKPSEKKSRLSDEIDYSDEEAKSKMKIPSTKKKVYSDDDFVDKEKSKRLSDIKSRETTKRPDRSSIDRSKKNRRNDSDYSSDERSSKKESKKNQMSDEEYTKKEGTSSAKKSKGKEDNVRDKKDTKKTTATKGSDYSEDEEDEKRYKEQKKKKSIPVKSTTKIRKKSYESSDTEDYGKKSSRKKSQKKLYDDSASDEEPKENRPKQRPLKISRSRKYSSSEEESRKNTSRKKARRSSSRSNSASD